MEPKLEIPNFRENDEATKDNTNLIDPTFSSSEGSEDWEKISEDWVSLFLDPTLLDEHPRYVPCDLEGCSQFDTTVLETNDHFSSQDLPIDSLLLRSIDNNLSHGDSVLESSPNVDKFDSFEKGDSASPQRSIKMNLTHSRKEPHGYTDTTSSTNSLTQLIGGSNSRIDINLWKDKECNPNLSISLNQELNGDISSSSNSPTFSSSVIRTERKFVQNSSLLSNQVRDLSCLLHCKEGETCPGDVGREAISSLAQECIPSTASQLEIFGVQHLYSIGNAIKVGLLGRSGDMEVSVEDMKESNKPINQKVCKAKSFGLHNQGVLKNLQSHYSNINWKRDGGDVGDEKQCTRLIHNLKSAKLSRHRINIYVDELECKLQTMTTTIAELNMTISHLTTENVNLRRQLGYYYPTPGVYPLRPGMPVHILPMRPYSGIVARRTMYSSRQMPHVPIGQIKTQTSFNNLKRTKSRVPKEGEDKKRIKQKAVGIASMVVIGLLFLVMMFGSFQQGFCGFAHRVDDFLRLENVQAGFQALIRQNENASSVNNFRFSKWESIQGWRPLEPGEYGPEREGVPSVHSQIPPKKLISDDEKLVIEAKKSQVDGSIPKIEFDSSTLQSIDENESLATSSYDYLNSMKAHLQLGNEVVLINASQSISSSIFIPSANGLAQVDGNLIIQAIMASDEVPKKKFEKEHNSKLKKRKEKKKVSAIGSSESQTMKIIPMIKEMDNLTTNGSRILTNTSKGAFATTKPLLKNEDSIVKTNNPILPVLRAGALQQWMLRGLYVLFVARELSKTTKSLPHVVLPVDSSKNVAATERTFYSYTPYDMAPRGPLNSWLFSGLSTEPILWKKNVSDIKDEAIFLPIKNEEKLESLMSFGDSLQPFTYDQFLQNKALEPNTCSVPTLSKLFWAATRSSELAKADLRQCLATDRPALKKDMCIELSQFNITSTTSPRQGSSPKIKTMADSEMAKTTQRNSYNGTSAFNRMHVVPRSCQVPFVDLLPPTKPKISWNQHENGTDPRIENIVQEQMHSQNMRNGVSAMVMSVLAAFEDDEDRTKQGTTKGLCQIFVVVLINNEKYVTYSCLLPFGGPQAHVVAE